MKSSYSYEHIHFGLQGAQLRIKLHRYSDEESSFDFFVSFLDVAVNSKPLCMTESVGWSVSPPLKIFDALLEIFFYRNSWLPEDESDSDNLQAVVISFSIAPQKFTFVISNKMSIQLLDGL